MTTFYPINAKTCCDPEGYPLYDILRRYFGVKMTLLLQEAIVYTPYGYIWVELKDGQKGTCKYRATGKYINLYISTL